MKIHNLIQGSPEWVAYRAANFNASDAPAMLGVSPYKTRAQLLRELHTGVAADVDIATQKRFDNGHRAEALARPMAEEIVGEELYPVTGSEGRMSASFDGLTLDGSAGFEHKALNDELRAAFSAMDALLDSDACRMLPIYHRAQMEHQLHVSGAERILFVTSEWASGGELVEYHSVWYYPDDELRGRILEGWAQFERDLAAYVLPESADPAPVGRSPEALPALRIELTGTVTASNLEEFKATALGAIRSVNRDLRTDQDFADAERAVKWCGDVESRLKAAKEHALSQTADIDALFKALDDISLEARTVRLDLDKLVARRKQEVKEFAVQRARADLGAHIAAIHEEIAPMRIPAVQVDFAAAIKGLKSLASMQDRLDAALAAAKIDADTAARLLRGNLQTYAATAEYGHGFLFPDLAALVNKAPDDFRSTIDARIAQHKAAEAKLERKRQEAAEEQRMAAETAAAESRRKAEAQAEAAAAVGVVAAPGQYPPPNAPAATDQGAQAPQAATPGTREADTPAASASRPPAPTQPEDATISLGAIRDRLGFALSADFIRSHLGVLPSRTDGRAVLYTETKYRAICSALISHVQAAVKCAFADMEAK